VVGVKAEVEKAVGNAAARERALGTGGGTQDIDMGDADAEDGQEEDNAIGKGEDSWLEIAVEIPGFRDDDALPVFLAAMLTEALLADGELRDRLYINRRFHWRLYVDVSSSSALEVTRHLDSHQVWVSRQRLSGFPYLDSVTICTTLVPAPTTISHHTSSTSANEIACTCV